MVPKKETPYAPNVLWHLVSAVVDHRDVGGCGVGAIGRALDGHPYVGRPLTTDISPSPSANGKAISWAGQGLAIRPRLSVWGNWSPLPANMITRPNFGDW